MKRIIAALAKTMAACAALMLACGCISVDYKGYQHPPTRYVKIFWTKDNVPDDKYEVMGKCVATAPGGYTSNEIYKKMMDKARVVGASAILITSYKKELIGKEAGPDFTGIDEPSPPSMSDVAGHPPYINSFGERGYPGGNTPQYEFETLVSAVFYRLKSKPAAKKAETENTEIKRNDNESEKK